MGILNRLIFPIPSDIVDLYIADDNNVGLFDEENNLILPIAREDYIPQDNSESGVIVGWQRSFVNFSLANYQFEATSRDCRQTIYYVLKALQSLSESTSIDQAGAYPLITCLDYHNDWDYKTMTRSTTGYVERKGVIKVTLQNGSFANSTNPLDMKWGAGVKINFTEITL